MMVLTRIRKKRMGMSQIFASEPYAESKVVNRRDFSDVSEELYVTFLSESYFIDGHFMRYFCGLYPRCYCGDRRPKRKV